MHSLVPKIVETWTRKQIYFYTRVQILNTVKTR